ncbi:MAG TPA: CHAT domain-containing protein [Thermoanaerobaculia bacterium]|jgi:CHAT domain-containing protein/Tfp pilus assembly protein PilF|nr:CHAT domain-containing protein [Thermoanaerobaculia bacterium]
MRLRPLRSWGLWLILALFLPSLLSAQGVVVETVATASALEKAGAREGDVFRAWTRLANPPANPEPASGTLESPFDWQWLKIEQAPRGPVELRGERQGEALVLQVPIGLWDAQVRPVLSAEMEDLYRRGKELVDKEQVEEGMAQWQQVAERAGGSGDWRLRAWVWLRIAMAWDKAGRPEKATTAYEAALRESRDPLSRIVVLEAMGESFVDQQRLEEAETRFRSAFELRKATWGESLQLARSLQSLGDNSLFRSYRAAAPEKRNQLLAAAQEQIERSLAIWERWAPGGVAVAENLDDLGLIAYQQGDLNKAATDFDKSISISTLLQPVSLQMALALLHRGVIFLVQGELAQAQALCQQALTVMERAPSPGSWMDTILTTLGNVTMSRGDLVGAEDYFRRALLLLSKRAPESLNTSNVLDSLGLVALERVDLDSAQEYFERSLQLRSRIAPGTRYVALSLSLLGNVARERGDLGSAERHFRESLAVCEQAMIRDDLIDNNLTGLAEIARERGDLAAVESYYRRSLQYEQRTASKPILLTLGQTALQLGRLKEAESNLREYLGSDDTSPSTDSGHTIAFQALANVLRRMGRLEQAARYADLSIDSLEAQIGELGGTQEIKGKVRGRNGDVYRDTLRLQLELGRPQEAFHLLERFRAQAFLSLLAARDLTFAGDIPPELDQERRQLAASYDRNELQLTELDPDKDRKAIEALQREQVQLRRRRDEIAVEMRRTAPRLAALQNPQALTFEQVREALDPGTVMLSYSTGKEQTHLFIVTPGRELHVETIKIGRQALEKDVDRFRQLIEQTQAGRGLGAQGLEWFSRRLYNLLVEPAEPWIAAGKRIVLVPDGPLHLLPFSALTRKDGRHLVEWKPLSTVLSGTVFAELKKQRRDARDAATAAEPSSWQWVAFGDPWFPPRLAQGRPEDIGEARLRSVSTRGQLQWKRLPQSRREVEEIAALFPADRRRTYLGREASEERAKAIGKDARIVHFATHAYVDDRSPFDSGLVLSIPEKLAEGRDNGLLQVWEIFESVRLDADLVVLSACETGIGEIRGGEGIIGLTRAFQYAGARSVLASLWRVEDEATAELMERFYRHLRSGEAKDEALRSAQLELIRSPLRVPDGRGGWTQRNAAAPYFWAALQLVGDGR